MAGRRSILISFVAALGACAEASEATPIVERSARDPLRCEVTAELQDFGLKRLYTEDYDLGGVQLANGDVWLSEVVPGAGAGNTRLVVTKVSVGGEPGEGQVVAEVTVRSIRSRQIVALPDGGFALLWSLSDRSLWLAEFDGAGAFTLAPKQVEGIDVDLFDLRARVSHTGNIGVLLQGLGDIDRFVALDPAGDPLGPARDLVQRADAVEATPDGGFALLGVSVVESAPWKAGKDLLLLTTDETGEPKRDAVRVATMGAGRVFWGAALVSVEDGYLLAWSETRPPAGDSPWLHKTGSYSVISIQRVDRDGVPLGDAVPLRAVRDSVADHKPVLTRFADTIAVFWSTGAYNYDCEMSSACSHRDRGQLILIDPADLTPRSELVELLRDPSYPNGRAEPRLGDLLRTELAVRGEEILITATLQDDDDDRLAPGFGSVRCQ